MGRPPISVFEELLECRRLSRKRVNTSRPKKNDSIGASIAVPESNSNPPTSSAHARSCCSVFSGVVFGFTGHKFHVRQLEAGHAFVQVRLVADKEKNKPSGYAFIEYMHTRDMKAAYKQADGRKLDNRRVLVDVERGRTVPNWRPRRLGGGLGSWYNQDWR